MPKKIVLSYAFSSAGDGDSEVISNDLIVLLDSINSLGSLSAAAKAVGYSYRHLWDELNHWEEEFGEPLVSRSRGRSCELTAFGKRLLWAEKEVQAKYASEIASLRAGIEQAYARATDPDAEVLTLHGCPDEALMQFRDEATLQKLYLEINFNSSLKGLQDLHEGRCQIAGFNFPIGAAAHSKAAETFAPYLANDVMLIGFAVRIQGIAVAKGNPLGLHSFLDVALKKATFVNRSKGTGTRVLADELLRTSGLKESDVIGYQNEVGSHSSVAASIASGKADAGLCIQSVASKMHLDFIPLVREVYYLVAKKDFLDSEGGQKLTALLSDPAWLKKGANLAGYDFSECGKVFDISHLGWNLNAEKAEH